MLFYLTLFGGGPGTVIDLAANFVVSPNLDIVCLSLFQAGEFFRPCLNADLCLFDGLFEILVGGVSYLIAIGSRYGFIL